MREGLAARTPRPLQTTGDIMNGILKSAAVALFVALTGLLSACSDSSSSADPLTLSATLTPAQENPPVLSSAAGNSTFQFFEASGELRAGNGPGLPLFQGASRSMRQPLSASSR